MNVMITGASRGIGLELVKHYSQRGARVFACCRNPNNAEALTNHAKLAAGMVSLHIADYDEMSTLQALAFELRNETIDLLISNAGIYGSARNGFGQVDVDDWLHTFKINSVAPLKLIEYFHEHLCSSPNPIVACMSSKMASMDDNGSGGSYIYRSSKAALNAVVKSLAVDLREDGIICVALHPGWVKTDMGGPDAEITVQQSVSGLQENIDRLQAKDSGRFIDIDGTDIPW